MVLVIGSCKEALEDEDSVDGESDDDEGQTLACEGWPVEGYSVDTGDGDESCHHNEGDCDSVADVPGETIIGNLLREVDSNISHHFEMFPSPSHSLR